ncbi:MAG: immunity 17 family protein [Sedimentisphaerales bacterium]|nr:immunity 17 family protein [Sedimentisphaerales bacterium]
MAQPGALILVLAGLFAVVAAAFDWEWFLNSRKARPLVSLLSRTGARIFYCVIGLGVAVLGLLIAFGVIVKN